jgi:hypothetical protein
MKTMVANKIMAWVVRIIMVVAIASVTVLLILVARDKVTDWTFGVMGWSIAVLGIFSATRAILTTDDELGIKSKDMKTVGEK